MSPIITPGGSGGGGSQPKQEFFFSSTAVVSNDFPYLPFTKVGGDTLVDLINPLNPIILADGDYTLACSLKFKLASAVTAQTVWEIAGEFDIDGDDFVAGLGAYGMVLTDAIVSPYHAEIRGYQSLAGSGLLDAGMKIGMSVRHRMGAAATVEFGARLVKH